MNGFRRCFIAQRANPLVLAPKSSPTAVYIHEGLPQASETVDVDSEVAVRSPTSTLWTAPSPRQARRSSSPRLPLLPALPLAFGVPAGSLSSSPAEHRDTESSLYYTASWGSPYQHPQRSVVSKSGSGHRHRGALSSDGASEDFTARRLNFDVLQSSESLQIDDPLPDVHTEGRGRAFSPRTLPRSFASALSRTAGKSSIHGFTEDWIRQYLSGQHSSERGNWWSDDSAEGESDSLPTRETHTSDDGQGWLDFDVDDHLGGELETPTLRRQSSRLKALAAPKEERYRRHKSQRSNETLKQTDFWEFLHETGDRPKQSDDMLASKYADSPPPTPAIKESKLPQPATKPSEPVGKPSSPVVLEKPLPPAPRDDAENISIDQNPMSSAMTRKATSSPGSADQRPKKRVAWGNRTVLISIPYDGLRGKAGGALKPLTPLEVNERLRKWEQDGFDTEGFKVWGSDDGQSRMIYPDPEEIGSGWKIKGELRISIPDRREWEAYVSFLKEEKLRALGVTLGDPEPMSANMSPAPSMGRMGTPHDTMTKPSPSQYPALPFSPPIPTPSSASNNTGHHFSPPFMPGTSMTPNPMPVASPASMHASIHGGFHVPRQSVSLMGGEQIPASPMQYIPQQSFSPISGVWPTQQLLNQHAMARGGSPAILQNLQGMGVVFSPSPVYSPDGGQSYSPTDLNQINQLRHRQQQQQQQQQQQLQNHLLQQQLSARQSPRLQEVWEAEEEEGEAADENRQNTNAMSSEIVTPVPLGHRQNVSLSLQKEIDDAEYHLEETIERQLELDEQAEKTSQDVAPEGEGHIKTNPHSTFVTPDSSPIVEYPEQQSTLTAETDVHHGLELPPDLDVQDLDHTTQLTATKRVSAGLTESKFADLEEDELDLPQVLRRPQSHDRNHSLSQRHYAENAVPSSAVTMLGAGGAIGGGMGDDFSEGARTNLSEIDTNPSVPSTPARGVFSGGASHTRALSDSSNPWMDDKHTSVDLTMGQSSSYRPANPTHGPKQSVSKLNVEAPEFKLDPRSSFSPGNFSFSGNNFQPAAPPVAFSPPTNANHLNHGSRGSLGTGSSLNVKAPTFKPGMFRSAFPTADFSFSSAGPKFHPTALPFTPRGFGANAVSVGDSSGSGQSSSEALPTGRGKIFTVPVVIKPTTKSKAIPIVPPEELQRQQQQLDHEESQEDEQGRIKQPETRLKRMRHGDIDEDDVPQFATPIPLLPMAGQTTNVEKEIQRPATPPQADKENKVPTDEEGDVASEKVAVKQPPTGNRRSILDESPDYEDGTWPSYEFRRDDEAQGFALARPSSTPARKQKPSSFDLYNGESDDAVDGLSVQQAEFAVSGIVKKENIPLGPLKHTSKSSLSADAKPFKFRPNANSFDATFGTAAAQAPASDAWGALEGSGYAATPPPPNPIDKDPVIILRPSEAGSFVPDLPEPRKLTPYPESADVDYGDIPIEEVNDVMTYMMENDPNMGVERAGSPWKREVSRRGAIPNFESPDTPYQLQPSGIRSDAPSPSPRRFDQQYHDLPGAHRTESPWQPDKGEYLGSELTGVAYESPVHRLNTPGDLPVSDWDDMVSETEEPKLQRRSRFFDSHINELVGSALEQRLNPLERTLGNIQDTLALMSARRPSSRRDRRSVSVEYANSDADDEDDDGSMGVFHPRERSPRKDRKLEMIRNVVLEALTSQPVGQAMTSPAELSEIQTALCEIRASVVPKEAGEDSHVEAIKFVIEESVARQSLAASEAEESRIDAMRTLIEDAIARRIPALPEDSGPRDKRNPEELQLRIDSLESLLRKVEYQAEEELKERRIVQDALSETQRLLRLSEEDAARQKQSAEEELTLRRTEQDTVAETQRLLRHAEEDTMRQKQIAEEELKARMLQQDTLAESQRRLKLAEEEAAHQKQIAEELQQKLRTFDDKRHQTLVQTQMRTALLEGAQENLQKTASALASKNSVLEASVREAMLSSDRWGKEIERVQGENTELRGTIVTLKTQMEESMRVREGMRGRFDRLQEDMATAACEIAKEQSLWTKKDLELKARLEVLSARLEAEARTRERLEQEIERLEVQEKEGMRLRVQVEQLRIENGKMSELANTLRLENIECQKVAAGFERDSVETKESARADAHRAKTYMDSQIEAANGRANIVRAELEAELARLRADFDRFKADSEAATDKSNRLLEEASIGKHKALQEVLDAKGAALQEQHRKYQRHLDDLKSQHERALHNALEDKQRAETHLLERLSLSDTRTEHLQDRVAHLEEKLEIAKSAANAAAQAAQIAKAAATPPPPVQASVARNGGLPERISPQALRESILVLQEQVQDREGRIEKLQETLSNVDTDAPAKIKERDTEIGWLRELLEVRISDLGDIIDILSRPVYDRDAVKDAAIRLKANLQMEQQEKERAMAGGQTFPSLASISSFASPKAVLPLAAAWGNWRGKGRENSSVSNLSRDSSFGILSRNSSSFGNLSEIASRTSSQTPSKSPGASGFLSGLLTPPSTNLRQTPQGSNTPAHQQNQSKDLAIEVALPRSTTLTRQMEKQPMRRHPPTTPPLLQKASYDRDAESSNFSGNGFYDDDDSTVDGRVVGTGRDEPFGPTIISRHR
ncbi:MAG: hypothetical protein M1839_007440 [Geoglossum umbratile]|nr:MAG: hypothetical protein M1839_007440 [Geoglossum umbratile]